jgi:hypothetical protein
MTDKADSSDDTDDYKINIEVKIFNRRIISVCSNLGKEIENEGARND